MAAKYMVIARELELQLRRSGESSKLPTEAELCLRFDCSRQTVRSALGILEQKGIIVKRRGSGSYPVRSAPRESRQIAVILADKEEYTSPELLRDIRRAAGELGCSVTCYETGGAWQREREILLRLLKQRPAGILLEPICDVLGCFSEDLLAQLRHSGIPLVSLNGSYRTDSPCVRTDDSGGAGQLMAHLSAGAHRQIAGILRSDESGGPERYRGCIRAAQEMGMEFRPENCLWFSRQEREKLLEGDDSLLRRFLREYRGNTTAVVCHNDEIAFRLLRLLRETHTDMAVVSFDNSYLALSREAAITSLGYSELRPGTEAVRVLSLLMEGKDAESVWIPWKLNIRKSG